MVGPVKLFGELAPAGLRLDCKLWAEVVAESFAAGVMRARIRRYYP